MLDFSEDATPEATAYAVKLLSHQRRDSALLPKAALWLMNHRNEGYWWSSTKQTAMVIYGLTDYLKVTNELNPNLNVTVLVNNGTVLTRKFDQATGIVSPQLKLDENRFAAGPQSRPHRRYRRRPALLFRPRGILLRSKCDLKKPAPSRSISCATISG